LEDISLFMSRWLGDEPVLDVSADGKVALSDFAVLVSQW